MGTQKTADPGFDSSNGKRKHIKEEHVNKTPRSQGEIQTLFYKDESAN